MKSASMPAFARDRAGQPVAALAQQTRPNARGDAAAALLQQAKAASLQNLRAFQGAIRETRELAQAVAAGGELYPWPLQDFARRLGEDLSWREKTLQLLIERQQGVSALPQDAAA